MQHWKLFLIRDIKLDKDKLKKDTIILVANQIYDKITKLFNDKREKFKIEVKVTVEPRYESFDLNNDGDLTFVHNNEVINLGNINEGLYSPSKMIEKLGVGKLNLMGFRYITDKDIRPSRYKDARQKESR